MTPDSPVTNHYPRRGDAVEAWIKAFRDQFQQSGDTWCAIDALLDSYRDAADTGTSLRKSIDEMIA